MIRKLKIEAIIEIDDEDWDIELMKETKDLYSLGIALVDTDEENNKGIKIIEEE